MPNVTFAPGVPSSPTAFYDAIDMMTSTALLTGATPTQLTLQLGASTYQIQGVGFAWTNTPQGVQVTGGTITNVNVLLNGAPQMSVGNLSLLAVDLVNAMTLDRTGADNAAIENLFLPLDWTYTGNSAADIFLSTETSSDGIALNLRGNDVFKTFGGNDHIFLGDGNDRADGGNGADTLEGGNGRDTLRGENGNDRLYGGASADNLQGGANNDLLNGAAAGDRFTGGTGSDTMVGGSGAGTDVFIFAVGDGSDRINDFTLGSDQIDLQPNVAHSFTASGPNNSILHYGPGTDQVLLIGVDLAHTGMVTII